MKKLVLFIVLLCSVFAVFPVQADEHASIQGKVIDSQTQQGLAGAIVSIPDLKISVLSDEAGVFKFTEVPARGRALVQVSYMGYQTVTKTINFSDALFIEFALKASVIEAREVVITGNASSSDNRKNSTSVSTVNREDLLYSPSTNLMDALSRVPGVSQVTTGPAISKPVIRGLSYNRVVTLNNGLKQQGQQWGDEHGIEIDQYSADRIEILRGPASLMYGSDALGGVINILDAFPAPLGTLRGEFLTNYATNNGMTGNSLMLQGNENGFVYKLRGSYKNAYSYKTPTEYVPNSGFNEKNFEGQVGLNKKWGYAHLDVSSFRNRIGFYDAARNDAGQLVDGDNLVYTKAQLKDRTLAYPQQDIRHTKVALNANILLGEGSLKTTVGYQHNRRAELEEAGEDAALLLNSHIYSYDFKYSFKNINGWAPVIGTSGEFIKSENTTGEEQLIPDFDSSTFGAFAFIKKSWDKSTLNAGARIDYRKMTGKQFVGEESSFNAFTNEFSSVSGALGYTYEFNDLLNFKANAGSAFRAPNIAELSSNGVHEGAFRYEIGNADLKQEQSFQFDAALEFQNQYMSASVGAFANYINNYIYYQTNGETIEAEERMFPVYRFVQDDAFLKGLEATLTFHPFQFLHFENSFGYTHATNRATDTALPFIPAATLRNELRFEPAIKGTKSSYISIGIDNFFKQNRVDSFEQSSAGYTLLNASIGTTLRLSKTQDITIYVAGKNLLNKAYYDHLSRFKPGRLNDEDPSLGIYNQGRNVTFGIRLPFELKK